MVRILVNESESLQCMIIKTQIHQCSPLGCKIRHSRMGECSQTVLSQISFVGIILLHVHEKSENKVEKDKKNLSTLHEASANNIYQSTTSISEISENKQ